MDLITQLGTAIYDEFGSYFKELVDNGYDVDKYYDGSSKWGDVTKVIVMVSVVRGAKNYKDYLRFFEFIGVSQEHLATQQMFARTSGIKANNETQSQRTSVYRQRNNAELAELRALRWIDEHLEQAKTYIDTKITP